MDDVWLDTVRIARDCGDISSLFPPGIKRLWDLPWPLHSAIRMALHFLSFEELPKKERPDKAIWLDNEAMTAWWAQVEENRKAEFDPNGVDTSEMPGNAFLKQMFPGLKLP